MPRRSSGGGRSSRGMAPRSAPLRNPPQPVAPAAPPALQRGPAAGGLGSAIADGLAFGTGSAVAHRAVDAVLGPRTIHHETIASQAPAPAAASPISGPVGADACSVQSRAFQDCISSNGSDIGRCQFYLDMLNECRRGSGSMLSA